LTVEDIKQSLTSTKDMICEIKTNMKLHKHHEITRMISSIENEHEDLQQKCRVLRGYNKEMKDQAKTFKKKLKTLKERNSRLNEFIRVHEDEKLVILSNSQPVFELILLGTYPQRRN
jgi:hypothetical protein